MEIITALFLEHFEMRQAEGGSARLDFTGVHFSLTAPGAFPIKIQPHLMVLLRCPSDHQGLAALEVTFEADGTPMDVRNVQPVTVDPGKFGYNLVQATLEISEPGTIEAHCRIDNGPVTKVPLSISAP
ncbi:MAG: hypothetical protein CL426_09140 [Acidimicrobiaceae bacterium]|nr:hypothetical protein [Acidimicrobiaceae bacterium]